MRFGGLTALALCLCLAGAANAQEPAAEYSADEFVKAILSGPQPCPKTATLEACEANPKTRRFTLASPRADKPAEPRRSATLTSAPVPKQTKRPPPRIMKMFAKPAKVTSSDVLVTFASGSSAITPQGQANLKSIAAGLNKPALAALTFEVAGFTDVTGSAATNRTLSRRRAEAVKAYLVGLSVSPVRLSTAGYGSDHLANPTEPASEANRRVELHRQN